MKQILNFVAFAACICPFQAHKSLLRVLSLDFAPILPSLLLEINPLLFGAFLGPERTVFLCSFVAFTIFGGAFLWFLPLFGKLSAFSLP